MKKLTYYINEMLSTRISKWIEDVYDTMENLMKDNKVVQIDVDVNRLSKPVKDRFKFKDFMLDKSVKSIVENKLIGFPIAAQMSKMPNKTLIDKTLTGEKKLDPECLPYWYTDKENNTYFVGLIIFEPSKLYIDEFAHIIDIEVSDCVKDPKTLLRAMYNDFTLHYINEYIGKYKGLTAKPKNPKLKATFIALKFRAMPDNKEILTIKI